MNFTRITAICFLMAMVSMGYFLQGSDGDKAAIAPHSTEVSPDVYRVVAENDNLRIIIATWEPGQKDDLHSHPPFAAYLLSDVNGKLHYPDGTSRDIQGKAGNSMTMPEDPAHIFENLSERACRMLLVELKRRDHPAAAGEAAPHCTEVSGNVYRVIAENKDLRVILATWKAGERDQFHSHPAFAAYFLTDTSGRLHYPDGSTKNIRGKTGHAMVMDADASHAFENLSDSETRMVLVEAK